MVAEVFSTSAKVKGFQARANRFKLIKNFSEIPLFRKFLHQITQNYIKTHTLLIGADNRF